MMRTVEKDCMTVLVDYLSALKPGDNTVAERNLAEFTGYNRTMIKLCFAILSFNGYVKTEHGKPHVLIKRPDSEFITKLESWK